MSWGGKRSQGDRPDYTREAMLRRRADRWRTFDRAGPPEGWSSDAIWAAGVWAYSPVLLLYRDVAGRSCLAGGGGDEANLDDDAPAGIFPQAMACARAADARPQPGQLPVLAARIAGLSPAEVIAYARAADAGRPTGWSCDTATPPDRRVALRYEARILGETPDPAQTRSAHADGPGRIDTTDDTTNEFQTNRSEL